MRFETSISSSEELDKIMSSSNTTNNSSPSSSIPEPGFSAHIRLALYVLVFLFSLVGNSIVIRAIRRVPGRKPLGYILVTNLATAELGNTLLLMWNAAYEELGRHWIFGKFLCKAIYSLQIVCFTALGYTLASIAVYRWSMIAAPLTRKALTNAKTKLLIVMTWLIGVAAALPALVMLDARENKEFGRTFCQEEWPNPAHQHIYTIIYMMTVILAPTVVILISYAMVALKLRQHILTTKRQAQKEERDSIITSMTDLKLTESRAIRLDGNGDKPPHQFHTLTMCVETRKTDKRQSIELVKVGQKADLNQVETPSTAERRTAAERKITEHENDLLKMIYIIVFISVVCYLPIQVIFLLYEFDMPVMLRWRYADIVSRYSVWLTILPSALHPLCYGTMSKFYAKVFSKLVACR